jgi:hypothetical protein
LTRGRRFIFAAPFLAIFPLSLAGAAPEAPTPAEASEALLRAVRFFHGEVARHGGYVWRTSADLRLREGEGVAGDDTIWVQPPGTPAVGEAFLDAYEATGDAACLDAARDAAHALVLGQLHSGGWFYRVEFDPQKRREFAYRFDADRRPTADPAADDDSPSGWEAWKKRKHRGNQTVLDDDTTQAAVRFLVRFDAATDFRDEAVHRAARLALESLLNAQYPNGAWSANYDRFPKATPPESHYPRKKAGFRDDWPRDWPKDFTGCYVTNDDLVADAIDTMLPAWEVYRDERYRASAERAGDFLILAQLPEPQPAWAQQYDRDMHPVWSRAFEPPAVSAGESQGLLEALLRLYAKTGNDKYLHPVPAALAYLRRSLRPDGRLARFYELKTNRPLYFWRDGERNYHLTYEDDRLPTHYAFVVNSRLEAIDREYRRLLDRDREPKTRTRPAAEQVRGVIHSMDARGAWVERRELRHHVAIPEGGVIDSRTFVRNVGVLSRFLRWDGNR